MKLLSNEKGILVHINLSTCIGSICTNHYLIKCKKYWEGTVLNDMLREKVIKTLVNNFLNAEQYTERKFKYLSE